MNLQLYNFLKAKPKEEKTIKGLFTDLETLGKGAAGKTWTAKVRNFDCDHVVLKQQPRTRHCENECEALRWIRSQILAGVAPPNFICMYDCFSFDSFRYIVLERADIKFDDFAAENNVLDDSVFIEIFTQIATAVAFLERNKFNHGDLWSENVMLSFAEHIPNPKEPFTIKIIDFDSSFKEDSAINSPSFGGSEKYRHKFLIGYDLNRFFDSLLYAYDYYIKRKGEIRRDRIKKSERAHMKNKAIPIVELDDPNDEDEDDFDSVNVQYSDRIIQFMRKLKVCSLESYRPCERMSGENILARLAEMKK